MTNQNDNLLFGLQNETIELIQVDAFANNNCLINIYFKRIPNILR